MTTAWLFPGQGAHYVGMATAWAARSPAAREALDEAADVLGFDLPGLMADGPADALEDTYNQQPALVAASEAIVRALGDHLPAPTYVAGHSLGEYSALVAAGALRYPDALRLVRERGRLMREAGRAQPGGMAAVLGLEDAAVEAVCADVDGVDVANYNAPGQVVISGTTAGVEQAVSALEAAGAKRVIPLPITIAAHSALMAPAAEAFAERVADVPLAPARVPVVANRTARPITAPDALRAELTGQLTDSVRWAESVRFMADAGVTRFEELGPGTVLTGLVRRTLRGRDGPRPELHPRGEPPETD